MPNDRPTLTEIAVRAAKPPEHGTLTLWDGAQKSFGLRVNAGGAKSFIVLLDSGRRHTIGRYGDITLAQARLAAQRLRAEKTLGRIFPKFIALSDARTEYLAQIAVRPNTRIYYERTLNHLKCTRLSDITAHHINRILDPMPRTSRDQALASFRTFFKWCMRRHYLDKSPCDLMTLSKPYARTRVLSDPELVSVWHSADRVGYPFGTMTKLLILTGQRRGEIGGLERSFINAKERTITLPSCLTKNGREHTFPYGDLLADVLETIPRFSSTDFLFPARGHEERPYSGWSKGKHAIDSLVPIQPWVLHDLRRTYATNLAAIRVPPHVIEKLLNHVSGQISGVAAIYNRFWYQDEMREAIAKWENHLVSLLAGEVPKTRAA